MTLRSVSAACAALALLATPAQAQAPAPLACDFKKAPVGSWADYTVKSGATSMSARWAFLGRDASGNTVELTLDGAGASSHKLGGRVVTRMLLVPDPVGVSKPFKRMVMQLGDREPVDV